MTDDRPDWLLATPHDSLIGYPTGIFQREGLKWKRVLTKMSGTTTWETYHLGNAHPLDKLEDFYKIEYLTEEEVFAELL